MAHSDEELLQHSVILHEVLAECPESFLQLFLTSTLTLLESFNETENIASDLKVSQFK